MIVDGSVAAVVWSCPDEYVEYPHCSAAVCMVVCVWWWWWNTVWCDIVGQWYVVACDIAACTSYHGSRCVCVQNMSSP